jgi:hypothetical protein
MTNQSKKEIRIIANNNDCIELQINNNDEISTIAFALEEADELVNIIREAKQEIEKSYQ